jgi:hypothetical protein
MFPITEIPSKLGIGSIEKALSSSKLYLALPMLLSALALCLKPISAEATTMATQRIGTLRPEDRSAVFQTAKNLGLDPYEFGALIHQESGFRPNVMGGAGGQYRGLIQFGPGARKEVGLPSKEMTIAEQLPYVEKYFQSRGYKPGMGIAKAYATVLGGNPNVSLSAKDSFGTSVGGSIPKFVKGGSLYKQAQATLGDPIEGAAPAETAIRQASPGGNTYIVLPGGEKESGTAADFLMAYLGKDIFKKKEAPSPTFNPTAMLTQALFQTPNYLE